MELGLLARVLVSHDQDVGGQLGGGLGEGVIAGQGGDELLHGLLAVVVLQEELEGGVVVAPAAEPVRLDEPAPDVVAVPLRTTSGQFGVGVVAGMSRPGR